MSGLGKGRRTGLTLVQAMDLFPREEAAREWFEAARCPHCGSCEISETGSTRQPPYRCRDCRQQFSVKTGTVMHDSKMPLRKWAVAFHLLSARLEGVSGMKLRRVLGITRKTGRLMTRKIRQGWRAA